MNSERDDSHFYGKKTSLTVFFYFLIIMNCNLVLNYQPHINSVTLILAVLVYKFVVKGNTERFQSSDDGNNFVVKDNINKNNIMTINNVKIYFS